MSYNRCPPFPCTVPPIRTGVFGSGRLFQPAPLALQAPGYAYLGGDQNPMNPLVTSPPCGPADLPPGVTPQPPPTAQTTVVGAGILSPARWRGNGVFADNYALPGDIAREPDEGWWASETIDADTGTRSWITSMSGLGELGAYIVGLGRRIDPYRSVPNWRQVLLEEATRLRAHYTLDERPGSVMVRLGRSGRGSFWDAVQRRGVVFSSGSSSVLGLGALGAASGWLNAPLLNVGGVTIPRWIGLGALAAGLWWLNKKKGWVKNQGRSRNRRRNVSGPAGDAEARELDLYIENDSALHHQMFMPIVKNLATKVAQGKYDHAKAVKGFMYLVDAGAKKYCQEFGCGQDWHRTFNTSTRRAVAESFAKSFEVENGLGNYKHLLPKKYQKNRRRTRRSRRSGR